MKKIIVFADDNESFRLSLISKLDRYGYDVNGFDNGLEALSFMQRNRFDLLIVDLFMPQMDGFDVITSVRKTISGTVPIIATASASANDFKTQIEELGATCYLTKPILANELIVRVLILIGMICDTNAE